MTFEMKKFVDGVTVIEAVDMNNIQKGVKDSLDSAGTKAPLDHNHDGIYVKTSDIGTLVGTNGTNGTNGVDGKEVEIQKSSTNIQWRYVGESTWKDIVPLSELKGADGLGGKEIELTKTSTEIQWRYKGQEEGVGWKTLVLLTDIKGLDGTNGTNGVDGTFDHTTEFPELKTTAKTIVGAINEIFNLASTRV